MIIEKQKDVTTAVLAELKRAPNAALPARSCPPSFAICMISCARRSSPRRNSTPRSAYIVAIGKHSSESHNEAVLMAGSLGLSALVCLLNNKNWRARD